jgi:hypothetical protein
MVYNFLENIPFKIRKLYSVLLWIPLIIFFIFCLYKATQSPIHDFANYYFGSQFTIKGEFDKSLYDPLFFNQKIVASGYESSWISYSPNPPFTTLLFMPFTVLDIDDAKLLFNIISVSLFLFSLRRLARVLQIPEWHIALIPFIFFLPIYNNISFGQVYFILFFLLVEGYLAMEKDKWGRCSLLWAIAIVFKITPGVLFFFLLFRRKYKALLMLSIACAALFSISLYTNGIEVWRFYISTILPKANQGEVTAAAFSINYQSAHMFFKFLFVPDTLDNPSPLFESLILFTVVTLVYKISILSAAVFHTRKESTIFSSWAIWILVSFLLSPYSGTYAYILLLIPLLIFYQKKKLFAINAVLGFVIFNLPIRYLYDAPFFIQFPKLYLLIAVFLTLIVWSKPSINWKLSLLLAGLFTTLEVLNFQYRKDNSSYLFDEHTDPLVNDFNIDNGYFSYTYWSGAGIQKRKTGLQATSLSSRDLRIIDNQIFYKDEQITSTPDKKLKASVLNENTIVYLSDKGRGYGFYAFRKILLNDN